MYILRVYRHFFILPFASFFNCIAKIVMLSESRDRPQENREVSGRQGLTDRYCDLETPRRLITPSQPPGSRKIELVCVDANVQLRVNFLPKRGC